MRRLVWLQAIVIMPRGIALIVVRNRPVGNPEHENGLTTFRMEDYRAHVLVFIPLCGDLQSWPDTISGLIPVIGTGESSACA